MHPLASETILSVRAVSLKRQGNEREKKPQVLLDMCESYSSCLQNISFLKGKKVRKSFSPLVLEMPQLITTPSQRGMS